MKRPRPESVDEAVGLLGEGAAARRRHARHAAPRHRRDVACVSLRRAGPGGHRATTATRVHDRRGDDARRRSARERRRSCTTRSSRSPRRRSATWRRSAATCSSPQPHGDLAVCLLALDAQVDRRRDGARTVGVVEPSVPLVTASLRDPARGSTRRRCGASRTRPRSSPSPPTARGSRSAASRREPVRALAAEAALAEGDDRERAAAGRRVEAADPFDDAYASAWYRRRVLPVHVRRALL